MNVGQSANKKAVLEKLLELGMVLVALDARADGVEVPEHLGRDPQLRLNLSYRFGLPMAIDPWGISATLTFGGVPHACRFPWRAIFLLVSHVNGEPYLFPDEVPAELLQQAGLDGGWRLPTPTGATPRSGRPRPQLSLVVPAEGEAPNAAAERGSSRDNAAEPPPRRTRTLPLRHAPRAAAHEQPSVDDHGPATDAKPEPVSHKHDATEAPSANDTSSAAQGDAPQPKGRQRGHLRVIK